jgi:hypothetical protein
MTDDRRKTTRRKDDAEIRDTLRELGIELLTFINLLAALAEARKESVSR